VIAFQKEKTPRIPQILRIQEHSKIREIRGNSGVCGFALSQLLITCDTGCCEDQKMLIR
jgi:hypothetical protein